MFRRDAPRASAADYLDPVDQAVRDDIADLAARVIERAATLGPGRWGATPYDEGIRINVGWTEILTAWSDQVCLVVVRDLMNEADLPSNVRRTRGRGRGPFYPSVPGSIRVEVPYRPVRTFRAALRALDPALTEAIRLAGRRKAGRGVKAGHRQGVVEAIETLTGRPLPAQGFGRHEGEQILVTTEGALQRLLASRYERSAAARRACVQHFGSRCSVCDIRFDEMYGELGRGFIHVHHLTSIAAQGRAHRVDPRRDLRPVCPNCHAMLHRQDPPLSIQDLRRRLRLGSRR